MRRLSTSLAASVCLSLLLACSLPPNRAPQESAPPTPAPVQASPTAEPSATPSRTPTPTAISPADTPTAAAQNTTPPTGIQLARLQRVDEQHGWALPATGGELLRTEDGGRSWQAVNPADLQVTNFAAVDADTAWVVEFNPDPQGPNDIVHHTADGGESWESWEAPFRAGSLQMLDAQQGWAFANRQGCAAGTCHLTIYRTTDGGRNWREAPVDNPLNPGAESFYPGTVEVRSGLALKATSPEDLWLAGALLNREHGENALLYASQDAGRSWRELRVPMPEQAPAPAIPAHVSPPTFVDATQGYFWAWARADDPPDRGYLAFFYSADGGETWTAQPGLVPASYAQAPVEVVNAQALFSDCQNQLCRSLDGAQTWETVESNLAFAPEGYPQLASFDFIDPQQGWAIVYTSEDDSGLYATTDGGQTWQALEARIAP